MDFDAQWLKTRAVT